MPELAFIVGLSKGVTYLMGRSPNAELVVYPKNPFYGSRDEGMSGEDWAEYTAQVREAAEFEATATMEAVSRFAQTHGAENVTVFFLSPIAGSPKSDDSRLKYGYCPLPAEVTAFVMLLGRQGAKLRAVPRVPKECDVEMF